MSIFDGNGGNRIRWPEPPVPLMRSRQMEPIRTHQRLRDRPVATLVQGDWLRQLTANTVLHRLNHDWECPRDIAKESSRPRTPDLPVLNNPSS